MTTTHLTGTRQAAGFAHEAASPGIAADAICLSNPSKAAEERERLAALIGADRAARMMIFAQSGGTAGPPIHQGLAGNMLWPVGRNTFASVTIGSTLRLFDNNWSRALFRHLRESLVDGGTLWVPFTDERAAERKGHWSLKRLREFFGESGRVVDQAQCVGVTRRAAGAGEPSESPSILAWSFANHGLLARINEGLGKADAPLDQEAMRRLLEPVLEPGRPLKIGIDPSRDKHDPAVRARIDHESRVESEAYYIHGVSYKSALLRHIFGAQSPRRAGLAWCDHGAGAGFLAAEMLLDESVPLREAVSCDNWPANALAARAMLAAMPERLAGRFRFRLAGAEEYEYDRPFDVVSFIGSLLYVPKDRLEETVDRAWRALDPGGLLIVHENIKDPAFKRDFEIMFTVDQIDGLLGRYASPGSPIRRWLSTATMEVSAEEAAAKSVFRVVRKPERKPEKGSSS